ncbi:MAG: IcmO, partial [uncultured bacterium]
QKASKEEAASIGANTNIKICMKLEDPAETWEFFLKTAGESYVAHASGFQADAQSLSGRYADSRSAQIEKRARIDLLDLKEQAPGEYHIFFKSRIVRAKTFFANPRPVKELRLNQFVKVDAPADAILRSLVTGFESFKKILQGGTGVFSDIELPEDDAKNIAKLFVEQPEDMPLEKGISALLEYREKLLEPAAVVEDITELPAGQIDIFAVLQLSDYLKNIVLADNIEQFSQPLLVKNSTRDSITRIEHILGKARRDTRGIASDLIKDMQAATNYPPVVEKASGSNELVDVVDSLIASIVLKNKDVSEEAASS